PARGGERRRSCVQRRAHGHCDTGAHDLHLIRGTSPPAPLLCPKQRRGEKYQTPLLPAFAPPLYCCQAMERGLGGEVPRTLRRGAPAPCDGFIVRAVARGGGVAIAVRGVTVPAILGARAVRAVASHLVPAGAFIAELDRQIDVVRVGGYGHDRACREHLGAIGVRDVRPAAGRELPLRLLMATLLVLLNRHRHRR